jgi:hypothetical protein
MILGGTQMPEQRARLVWPQNAQKTKKGKDD